METPPDTSSTAYVDLIADVASALDDVIPAWRARLGRAAEQWRMRGINTAVLERALTLSTPPDVEALLATFERAVDHLAALEVEAVGLDASLVGAAVFRDPGRVREAAALVAGRRAPLAARPSVYPDAEHWVLAWPDAGDLLAGSLA